MTVTATAAHTAVATLPDEVGAEINKDQWNGTAAHDVVITGLGSAAEAATTDFDAAGVATAAVATHVGLADPHTQYSLEASLGTLSTQNGTSGVYTPGITEVANLDAATSVAYECQYIQIGSVVSVSGKVDINPATPATSTKLGISLPVASNIGAEEDCAGVAACPAIAGQVAAIIGDAANNLAQLQWIASDVTLQSMFFKFQYQVI